MQCQEEGCEAWLPNQGQLPKGSGWHGQEHLLIEAGRMLWRTSRWLLMQVDTLQTGPFKVCHKFGLVSDWFYWKAAQFLMGPEYTRGRQKTGKHACLNPRGLCTRPPPTPQRGFSGPCALLFDTRGEDFLQENQEHEEAAERLFIYLIKIQNSITSGSFRVRGLALPYNVITVRSSGGTGCSWPGLQQQCGRASFHPDVGPLWTQEVSFSIKISTSIDGD